MSTFLAVVETGSFAAAARRTGMTRSAVSRQIAALEQALGTTLIVRTTRTSHLTREGETYYARCCEVLQLAEQAKEEAQSTSLEISGTLRVVAPLLLHQTLIPIIREFLAMYPKVFVDIEFSDKASNLVDEGIDLAIRVGPSSDSTLTANKIATVKYVVCASPKYLAERGTPTTPAELTEHSWISFSPLANASTRTFFKKRRPYTVRLHRVFATNASIALRDAMLNHMGITVIPRFYVEDALGNGQLQLLLSDYQIPDSGLYALYPSQAAVPGRIRAFLDVAKDNIQRDKRFGNNTEVPLGSKRI